MSVDGIPRRSRYVRIESRHERIHEIFGHDIMSRTRGVQITQVLLVENYTHYVTFSSVIKEISNPLDFIVVISSVLSLDMFTLGYIIGTNLSASPFI